MKPCVIGLILFSNNGVWHHIDIGTVDLSSIINQLLIIIVIWVAF